jgi:6-phosphogluconolactonase
MRVLASPEELARTAAREIQALAAQVLSRRSAFHIALAGGSTPRATYEELARSKTCLADRWHVWFGDERCVPPDHPDSNYGMARASGLLARVPEAQVHRMRGESSPQSEALRYAAELELHLGIPPTLDLVLLGLGTDGHTASLFPGTSALEESSWVSVGQAPKPPFERLTLTYPVLCSAERVFFLVAGSDKRDTLRRIWAGDQALPARAVQPRGGEPTWFVDRAAAPDTGKG